MDAAEKLKALFYAARYHGANFYDLISSFYFGDDISVPFFNIVDKVKLLAKLKNKNQPRFQTQRNASKRLSQKCDENFRF